jgi:GntR family transcriptional repressor for pyruvate dehydrogenase complex
MTSLIKKQHLVEQVIEHLNNIITSGSYAIGTKLPAEPQLMEELGVGRSTLREAIRVLSHSGVLEVRQGYGTYVRALPENSEPLAVLLRRARFREVQEVRRTLEIEIVRLAAERHRQEDLSRIRNCLNLRQEALDSGDLTAVLDADIKFHCSVAEAAGNAVMADLYRTFALSLRKALATQWEFADSNPAETTDLHVRLFNAIAARNAAEAVATTIALLDRHESTVKIGEPGLVVLHALDKDKKEQL